VFDATVCLGFVTICRHFLS